MCSSENNEEEDSDSRGEAPAARELRAQRERKIRLYGEQGELELRQHGEERDYHEEIEKYTQLKPCRLFVQGDNIVTSNPLTWWKEQQHDFPRLAQLARRYLCITSTSGHARERFPRVAGS